MYHKRQLKVISIINRDLFKRCQQSVESSHGQGGPGVVEQKADPWEAETVGISRMGEIMLRSGVGGWRIGVMCLYFRILIRILAALS